MTILSGQSIRKRGIFTPFSEKAKQNGMSYGLSQAGYDIRIDLSRVKDSLGVGYIYMEPGAFMLAATLEHFDMPNDLVGIVHDKSTWARRGIACQNTVIEPGWKGFLTLELTNHSDTDVCIHHGDPIAQILLHLTDEPVEEPYAGKYQNQEKGPQDARFE